MRTLQEKYNAIQEGTFSKDHFLAEARMQQPQLITRFNGYDDAVQILKNRGMIQEGINPQKYLRKIREVINNPDYEIGPNDSHMSEAEQVWHYLAQDFKELDNVTEAEWDQVNNLIEAELKKRKQIREATQPKPTKKGLADYRYKPTNEMDKYPYEQILRGLRVELEGLSVLGTPTPEEYTKALGKVLKNLEKDSIFYTNQVAGVKANKKRTDVMVDATPKNEVDKENGLKKAALKEAKDPDIQELVLKLLKKNPSMTWTQAMKKVKEDLKDDKSQKDQLKEAIKGVIKNILSEGVNLSPEGPQMFEDEDIYEMQSEKSDSDYRNELNDFLEDHQIYGYTGKIHDIMTGPDENTAAQELEAYLEDNQIYGRTYLTGILDIYSDYPYDQHWMNQPDEDEADDVPHPRGYEEASDEEDFDDLMEEYTPGQTVTFTNTNDGNKYTGTVVKDLGNGRFTFRAEDGKVYGSEGFGRNWKIKFEADGEDIFESVSLFDILDEGSSKHSTEWFKGYRAFNDDKKLSSNPYKENPKKEDWKAGWNKAQSDEKKNN